MGVVGLFWRNLNRIFELSRDILKITLNLKSTLLKVTKYTSVEDQNIGGYSSKMLLCHQVEFHSYNDIAISELIMQT